MKDLGSQVAYWDGVGATKASTALISRGRQLRPDLRFDALDSPPTLAHETANFDVVLFAVLTCVPDDDAQRALIADLARIRWVALCQRCDPSGR
ncbi:hypothetical protein [Nonomuraea sp. CA-141351]|uniref:hypothetical protein n=1 Tax=Nonomuraea sp. CA-141351 TaxID=3239996 RepID=UPI003D8FA197